MRRLLMLCLALLVLSGCAGTRDARVVSLRNAAPKEVVAPDASPETKPIRIAASSIISPTETIRSYGSFFSYLERKVGRPLELVQRKTYDETYEMIRYGTLDVAMICTYVYVLGHEQIGLEPLAAPEVNGKAEYQSFVIVRAESGIRTWGDLAQKRFAFTDPLSTSGRIYPLSVLKGRGEDPGTFFASTTYTYSHDNSIKAVVQGLVDGAAVDSLVYDQWILQNPDLGLSLRIIDRSEPMPSPPIVVGKRLDPAVREAFRRALITMHEDPDGKEILKSLGIDRWVPQSDEEYKVVREYAQRAGMKL